jgi:CheY-like chemotaxis protein
LVIDDEPAARELLRRSIERAGFIVDVAPDGATGLELARRHQPAVITLDVMMPGLDGWAVLNALKADPATWHIPVVMVSMVDDEQLGMALGAVDYFTKPVDGARLAAVLGRLHRSGSSRHVLLVEDDEPTRSVLTRILHKEGWGVAEAPNGRVALDRLAQRIPDLIVLDLMMPGMDGFEFAEALARNEAWRNVPVVVLTAKDVHPQDRERLRGLVTRVMQKTPAAWDHLVKEIRARLQ